MIDSNNHQTLENDIKTKAVYYDFKANIKIDAKWQKILSFLNSV